MKQNNDLKDFFQGFSDVENQLQFKMASEIMEKIPTISTGSYILDDMLGCGGLPCGRIIQYYGPPGSGKSLMSLLAIKEAQRSDPTSKQVYIDAENTFSHDWCQKLGIDLTRVGVVDSELASNGRLAFEFLLGVPKEDKQHIYTGKSKDGLLDKIIKHELNVNLIVLDSIGSILVPQEDSARVGKINMALLARFLTPTFRKLSLEISKAKIPFIVINHKRDSMEMYGPDHTFSGGNTFAHSLSANIYFEAVQRKDAMILDNKENKVGHVMRATLEKSKFGPWPKKCEFKVNFRVGVVDLHEEIATLALEYDIVTKSSTMSYEYGDRKWVGAPKFNEALANDPALAEELLAKIKLVREAKLSPKSEEKTLEIDETPESTKRGRKTK